MRHARRTARSNPRAPTTPKNPTLVLVRRFDPTGEELSRWEPLYRDDGDIAFFSPPKAKAAALAPPSDAGLHVGDLIVTVPAEAVSGIEEYATGLYVVTPNGVKTAPKPFEFVDRGGSWLSVWGQDAERMLSLSVNVDRKRKTMAACECAETVLHLVPAGEGRPREAVETAVAWCRDAASTTHVKQAAASAQAFASEVAHEASKAMGPASNVLGAYYAATAATKAASVVVYHEPSGAVVSAASAVNFVAGTPNLATFQRLAPLVEKWIPLPVVLLTWLGNGDAIPFDPSMVPTVPTGPRENPRRGRRHNARHRGRR
jgi:hypothetical protein